MAKTQAGKRIPSVRNRRIDLVCTTCMATFGSGVEIGFRITKFRRALATDRDTGKHLNSTSFEGAHGVVRPSAAARPLAEAMKQNFATLSWDFVRLG